MSIRSTLKTSPAATARGWAWRSLAAVSLGFGLLAAGAVSARAEGPNPGAARSAEPAERPARADFAGEPASDDARKIADWIVQTDDSHGQPFVIVDKKNTRVFVFDGGGRLLGATPVLIGLARGDESAPGIGDRKLSQIPPRDRTTPAGRFVASLGHGLGPRTILWVDYDAALALHRVLAASAKERRLERLAAASPSDHRITFGCINVPAGFYDRLIEPVFAHTSGVVYILPEIKSLSEVFFASAL